MSYSMTKRVGKRTTVTSSMDDLDSVSIHIPKVGIALLVNEGELHLFGDIRVVEHKDKWKFFAATSR